MLNSKIIDKDTSTNIEHAQAKKIIVEDFCNILTESYMSYTKFVILSRALPNIDGLKVVQARILYSMYISDNTYYNRFRKGSRIIGDVSGKYHPHGEASIYDCLARLTQDFSYYVPMVDGQGNFGSADGDSPAASRYTEARLSKVGTYLLSDLSYENILVMRKNYDASLEEPTRLPIKVPLMLINGVYGIAVGCTSLIPSHFPLEIVKIVKYFIDNMHRRAEISYEEIKDVITGPDFKIYCIVDNIHLDFIYTNGYGPLLTSSKIEYDSKNNVINIYGMPFNVKKMRLIESIANAINEKIICNVLDLVDYTKDDKYHLQLVLDKGANADILIKRLKKYTLCSNTVGCSFRFVVNNKIKILNLTQIINMFLDDRIDIIKKRILEEIRSKLASVEKILALYIAISTNKMMDMLTEVLNSDNLYIAREKLSNMSFDISSISTSLPKRLQKLDLLNFNLTSMQIEYLLNMQIRRLNKEKISELKSHMTKYANEINNNEEILSNEKKICDIIVSELDEFLSMTKHIKNRICDLQSLDMKIHRSLLEEEIALILAIDFNKDFIWRESSVIKTQKRGGKGKFIGAKILAICSCTSHDEVFLITSLGKIFKLDVFDCYFNNVKLSERISLVDDTPVFLISKRDIMSYKYILIFTNNGLVKKHLISTVQNINKSGKYISNLDENDNIKKIVFANDNDIISIFTKCGRSISFDVDKINLLANIRTRGSKGIKLKENDELIDAIAFNSDAVFLIIITNSGYAKKVKLSDINTEANRNTLGSKFLNVKYGGIIAAISIQDDTKVLVSTVNGNLIMFATNDIPILGKSAKGVKVLDLSDNDSILSVISF